MDDSDMVCGQCGAECKCDCVNCGERRQLVYERHPLCVDCFGIFLATGKTPDREKPIRIVTVVGKARRGQKKPRRKDVLLEFMQDQGWSKSVLQKVLDSL